MEIKQVKILLIIFLFITGCIGEYGKIARQPDNENKVTIQDLKQKWNQYFVYSGTRDGRWKYALMFDPKGSGSTLTGDSWVKINDETTFLNTLNEVEKIAPDSEVMAIKGPNNKVFGFMYYPSNLHVPVKIIDDTTLYVMSLPKHISAP